MRNEGVQFLPEAPLANGGVTKLIHCHRIMEAGKHFFEIQQNVDSIREKCDIRAGSREDEALGRALQELRNVRSRLLAPLLRKSASQPPKSPPKDFLRVP